jgi:8-oxo-dGTP pyrophosphatase MutT (NUDIX family)
MPNAHAHRLTSRILLSDEDGRILLFLTAAPDSSGATRWITPGGGVDPGEDHRAAAVRELFEETGLAVDGAELGEPVFAEDFTVEWDSADHDTGHVEFYALRTTAFEPSSAHWTDEERVDVTDWRWWDPAALAASGEPFEPQTLPTLATRAIAAAATPDEKG